MEIYTIYQNVNFYNIKRINSYFIIEFNLNFVCNDCIDFVLQVFLLKCEKLFVFSCRY